MELSIYPNFYRCPRCGSYQGRPAGESKIRRVRKCKGCGSVVTMDIPKSVVQQIIKKLPEPVPAKGKQGLWNWEQDVKEEQNDNFMKQLNEKIDEATGIPANILIGDIK